MTPICIPIEYSQNTAMEYTVSLSFSDFLFVFGFWHNKQEQNECQLKTDTDPAVAVC